MLIDKSILTFLQKIGISLSKAVKIMQKLDNYL